MEKLKSKSSRIEHDSMGKVSVPKDALYGAQTQRAIHNFNISSLSMPQEFIKALAIIKRAAAFANMSTRQLDDKTAKAIIKAASEIIRGKHLEHFPIDVFQTGSGTSSNMNANEVIAILANHIAGTKKIHPNDHVNMSQSSNDVIPAAIHIATAITTTNHLLPNLNTLLKAIKQKAIKLKQITKTGRTHLMDAMPITFGQELSGWHAQVKNNITRIKSALIDIEQLPLGGTAVGTGINASPKFVKAAIKEIAKFSKIKFSAKDNYFEAISSQDSIVAFSGQLKTTATSFMKIANDLRWMNSGPLTGLSEISLPAIQPGSSIMPGKVNPVMPEAICMAAAQVMGNDTTITIGGQSGNFQLNVMLPVIAYNILQSIELLSNSAKALAKVIAGFKVNETVINDKLSKNPILVTALNKKIGYEKGAEIAKAAYRKKSAVIDVAADLTDIPKKELEKLLDPKKLT